LTTIQTLAFGIMLASIVGFALWTAYLYLRK